MEKAQDMEMSPLTTDDLTTFRGHKTMVSLWAAQCAKYGDRTCHREKKLGIWQEYSWREYYETAKKIGLALMDMGIRHGDVTLILSEDRREWLYCDLGSAAIGAIPSGVYTTDSPKQLAYLANDSGAKVLFVENDEQLDKWLEARADMPGIEHVIVFDRDGLATFSHPQVIFYDELLERGAQASNPDRFEEALGKVQPEDGRMMIYTSGTTGPPKGAIISHRNMVYQVAAGERVFGVNESDEQLCFLPLCHVLERLVSVEAPIANGSTVNFAESPETVFENMREVSPHTFVGVPRIWEKIYSRVMILRTEAGFVGGLAFDWALGVGRKYAATDRPSPLLRLSWALAQLTVLGNLRRMVGLANCRRASTGGAPCSPDLIRWYQSIGVPMIEAFGMTETSGVATLNRVEDNHIGTAGKALPGTEIKLDSNGELLMRGPGIFSGYWNKPEKTAETFTEDGWLRSGDVARIDENGCMTITGRIKDIIITAGGKNITPAEIESRLKFSHYISDAVIIGDRRKFLTALIMIDQENVEKYAQDQKVPFSNFASLCAAKEVKDLIKGEVEAVNKEFARVEQIKDFRLIDVLLTAEDEELTATMKLKRSYVEKAHAHLIEEMY